MDDAAQIAAIKARCDAATAEPWEDDEGKVWGPPGSGLALYGATRLDAEGQEYGPIAVTMDGEYVQSRRFAEDAAFIAHAHQDVPALLALIRELTQTIVSKSEREMADGEFCCYCGGHYEHDYSDCFVLRCAALLDACGTEAE